MLARITDFCSSRRGAWITIAVWVVLAAVIVPLAPTLESVTRNESSAFLPDGAESTRVAELVEERFPSGGTPVILVFNNPAGLNDADRAVVQELGEWLRSEEAPDLVDPAGIVSIFTVPNAAASLVSADGTTMTMVVNVLGDPASEEYLAAVEAIDERTAEAPAGLEIRVSGPGGLLYDLISVFTRIDTFLTLVTAGLVLVLLILIYRSPVIALVPLIAVGWVFSLAAAIGAFAAQEFGLPINGQARGIMTVLLFGAGTDYTLFISSRYREELERVEDKHEAMQQTMRAVGEAIISSAGTVLVATLLLLFAVLRSSQALAPLLSIAVALMLVASLTLVPAIISVLGRVAYWPLRPRYNPAAAERTHAEGRRGIWSRIADAVARRPAAYLLGTVAVFLILSAGLLRYEVTYDALRALPADTDSRQGFELLRQSFPPGQLAPTEVYVVLPGGQTAYDRLPAIAELSRELSTYQGVAAVESVATPFGVGAPVGPDQVGAAAGAIPPEIRAGIDRGEGQPPGLQPGGDEQLAQAIGLYAASRQFVSADSGVARLSVTLTESPYALAAIEDVDNFRTFTRDAAARVGLGDAEVLVGGETATAFDTKVASERDSRVVLPLILLAIGVILALLLRSLVAPLYLLATIVLSYAATLGLSTVLFIWLFGHDGVSAGMPFFLFVFLVALGVDYNIFLMSRVREETAQLGLEAGTRRAVSRTGGVITSAGIILAGTFAALMTLPLRDLVQLGFAVALGVLLDTFIVRTVMVPAIVLLLDRWNWWPSRVAERTVEVVPAEKAVS